MRNLSGSVIVITGASSGIGRIAAHAFAREGACLVLAARRERALNDAVRECEALGARGAIAVPTDVADPHAVERLADRAVAAFGRLDVWVNNAAVVLFGRFDEAPLAAFRRVVEINLFGYVHGARAALRQFRAQGHGVLINNASILGRVGMPYASAYVASKFAICGLSQCQRQELQGNPGIRVCTVVPVTMDTAIFQRGANYTPWRAKAVDPVYHPAVTAAAILRLAKRPEREAIAGGYGYLIALGTRLAPGLTERLAGWLGPRLQFQAGAPNERPFPGNLFRPIEDGYAVTGGWRERSTGPLLGAAGLAVIAAAAVLTLAFGPARAHQRQQSRHGVCYRRATGACQGARGEGCGLMHHGQRRR
jgi:NAD(P)-dependent dehydrogenase (short-subunit alcohol dehydrogenase family)